MVKQSLRRLRIAHTVSSLENLSAGPSYSVPNLARGQALLGVDAELHSLDGCPSHFLDGLTDHRHQRDFRSLPILNRMGCSNAMKRALAGGLHDVVHTHGVWLMANTYRSRTAAFVVAPRGMLTPVALEFSRVKKRVFGVLRQNGAFAFADLFHATAQSEYEDIRAFGIQQPVAIIPNGIDIPELFEPELQQERRKVISLGRVHPKKGLDRLIAAWAHLEDAYPSWDLEIVGPDQQGHLAELQAQAASLKLARVSFRGPIHGAEKVRYMSSAALFVLPSRSENFAMTVAESLACGVPAIATHGTPWAGLGENRCGWWVGHTPCDLAAALRTAMDAPPSKLQAMGRRGRTWMRNEFSWARAAQMSLDAYDWILGRGDKPDYVHGS